MDKIIHCVSDLRTYCKHVIINGALKEKSRQFDSESFCLEETTLKWMKLSQRVGLFADSVKFIHSVEEQFAKSLHS